MIDVKSRGVLLWVIRVPAQDLKDISPVLSGLIYNKFMSLMTFAGFNRRMLDSTILYLFLLESISKTVENLAPARL